MMQQYLDVKEQYDDCILFYRLGDFYEMFFEDALLVSKLLELTLTGRNCGLEERAPMCGVPFHAADSYIEKLVKMGYKVAICEQLEEPSETKGMVKRGVIRVVTPGTMTGEQLDEKENNYLAAIDIDKKAIGICFCDISTGELRVTEKTSDRIEIDDCVNELVRISPSEIIISPDLNERYGEKEISELTSSFVRVSPKGYFDEKAAEVAISTQFEGLSMTALGLDGRHSCIRSLGALLAYLRETQMQDLEQLTSCVYYDMDSHMSLDRATIRNLEITQTLYDKKTNGSLLSVLDKTKTAMGARLIKKWLREPLNVSKEINARLGAVESLSSDPIINNNLSQALSGVYDFERLIGRIVSGNANARDMIALKVSVSFLPDVKQAIADADSAYLDELNVEIIDLSDVYTLIDEALIEDPPFSVREGGIIREGFSEELDKLKSSISDSKSWIAGLEAAEKQRTGIKTLKVGYNKVFGYYIEVSKSQVDKVPEEYIRKQTLVGAERYITPRMKEVENIVLNAETKINKLEYQIFTGLRNSLKEYISEIQTASRAVAAVDVLSSFAVVSSDLGYVKPIVDDSKIIDIENGRHPVIERTVEEGLFVANNVYIDGDENSMLIITGPNMAGKSTYMRQTALIILMAQAGCFVPADKAHIGVVDRIFTRIGASDNLSMGQSTFYVEMSELAYILRNAGARSFILLDEIGRGTSTYDGLSIAAATVRYLCNEKVHIRTMFATHYHELTTLDILRGVCNLNVDVSDDRGEIIFLHKIVPGAASRSYGIHVARIAGVPSALLEDAEGKLVELNEKSDVVDIAADNRHATGGIATIANDGSEQLSIFNGKGKKMADKLRSIDLMEITPAKAIAVLEELKKAIE